MTFVSNTQIARVFIRSAQQVRKLSNCVGKGKRWDDIVITSARARAEGNMKLLILNGSVTWKQGSQELNTLLTR